MEMKEKFVRTGHEVLSNICSGKKCGGKEVLVEVLMIVISLSMVMLFKTQIMQMATDVFTYCSTFISSNFSGI